MNDDKEDQLLEDYLKGGSDLSRHYRGESAEKPPAHLDAVILRAGQFAARKHRKPVTPLWYVPLSLAAILVIGFSVLIKINDYQGKQLSPLEQGKVNESAAIKEIQGRYPKNIQRDRGPAMRSSPPGLQVPAVQTPVPASDNQKAALKPQGVLEELTATGAQSSSDNRRDINSPHKSSGPQGLLAEIVIAEPPAEKMNVPATITSASPGSIVNSEAAKGLERATMQSRETTALDEKPRAEASARMTSSPTIAVQAMKAAQPPAAATAAPSANSPDEWLAEIRKIWQDGRKDDAVQDFKRFLAANPDYPKAEIASRLPEDFDVEKFINDSGETRN